MAQAVLLHHELADGSWHYDWMIQRLAGPGGAAPALGSPLVTWRVSVRIDETEATRFDAVRLTDHRPDYLMYEGPVSGNRGSVRRVADGQAVWHALAEGAAELTIAWRDSAARRYFGRLVGAASDGAVWKFESMPACAVL